MGCWHPLHVNLGGCHRGEYGKIQPELHAQYIRIPTQRDLSPSYTASHNSPLRGRLWPQEQGLCHSPCTPSAWDLRYVRSKLAEHHCWDRDPTDQSLTPPSLAELWMSELMSPWLWDRTNSPAEKGTWKPGSYQNCWRADSRWQPGSPG